MKFDFDPISHIDFLNDPELVKIEYIKKLLDYKNSPTKRKKLPLVDKVGLDYSRCTWASKTM